MSTFDGIVKEFPDIRIDHFRSQLDKPHPSACFLSHVHSDHLTGLETLKMPFVYCSATTRRILLRMEKYSHRVNFARGILEASKQTYKHLKLILRPLPLQTPVELELGPKRCVRVTLFDANHCLGAVMFLIEGEGKAVLYTGDIRAEAWWVNSIARNPFLLPFTTGAKVLDCLYLDTTFASHSDMYKNFPTKAEGLNELRTQVEECPHDSIFYFRAWTLGYEDVWLTLSSALGSKVHVDPYQLRLFQDHNGAVQSSDATAALGGFQLGNDVYHGCLSTDRCVQIHSCEPGLPCHLALSKRTNVVWLTPIISRMQDGTEVAEIGAGGGGEDLYQNKAVELANTSVLEGLRLLAQQVPSGVPTVEKVERTLRDASSEKGCHAALNELMQSIGSNMSIGGFVQALASRNDFSNDSKTAGQQRTIHFPFSRHSSYSELRHLVRILQPRDICPCVVDIQSWTEECSVEELFGDCCSGSEFHYDAVIRRQVNAIKQDEQTQTQSQDTQMTGTTGTESIPAGLVYGGNLDAESEVNNEQLSDEDDEGRTATSEPMSLKEAWRRASMDRRSREIDTMTVEGDSAIEREILCDIADLSSPTCQATSDSCGVPCSRSYTRRREAFEAAMKYLERGNINQWESLFVTSIGQLGHTEPEVEL